MTDTKTGVGGFEIDGKVYEFDVGDPNAPGIEPVQPDDGDINVDHSKKDLGKKTRSTLGKYLSDVTKGKHGYAKGTSNSFPVDPPKTPTAPDEISISTEKGLPSPITDTQNSARFSTGARASGTTHDSPDLRANTSKTVPDPATTLSDLGKGKQGKPVNGHTLLKRVGKDNTPEPVETYRETVLSVNRFTAQSLSTENKTYTIDGKTYTKSQLNRVGKTLSAKSGLKFPNIDLFNPISTVTSVGETALNAVFSNPNISYRLLEAKDALENLVGGETDEINIAPAGNQSWGVINNTETPWAGLMNTDMIAMALIMQTVLLLAFEGLGALISAGGTSPPTTSRKKNGLFEKGSSSSELRHVSQGNPGFPPDISALLGLRGTKYPFGDALKVGTAAFFVGGDKAKEGVGSQLIGALTSAATNALSDNTSAGFIVIVSRMILRSVQQVVQSVLNVGKAFASLNPISGVNSLMSLLTELRRSKLIAAINVFALIGDAILSEDEFTKDPDATARERGGSTIDALNDDAFAAAARKNRLTGRAKLAWASNRSPAMYLLPDSVATMSIVDTKLGAFKGPMGINDDATETVVLIQTDEDRSAHGARIPNSSPDPEGIDVKKMEAMLEAEYVPFYFHDLRTNEIISFHAFLASMTENYTANWESSDGYGRVDPIKIYKNTVRKIDISFYIASLDENDFDEMWIKINKLVTLVYPQYTKGRLLQESDNSMRFIQPFSQLISASPLIRLRLGDLIRSNYSRFALARLFGAADNVMKVNGSDAKFSGARAIIEKLTKTSATAFNNRSNRWHVSTVGWAAADGGGQSLVSIGGPSTPDQAPTFNVEPSDLQYIILDVRKVVDTVAIVDPIIMPVSEMTQEHGMPAERAAKHYNDLKKRYASKNSISMKVVGGENGYVMPLHALRPTQKTFKKLMKEAGAPDAIEGIDNIAAFLSEDKNALVKSFSAMQGKGLAGAIETMNFDWYDRVTWDVRPGHRAPKMCKVTISFAPIHDISPGLDSLGYNRAPVYPVGGAMGKGFDTGKG